MSVNLYFIGKGEKVTQGGNSSMFIIVEFMGKGEKFVQGLTDLYLLL